jgi:hypothetical protein
MKNRAPTLWQDPRRTLTYEHDADHRIVSFDELGRLGTQPATVPPVPWTASERFILCPSAPRWVQKEFQAEEMMQEFLAATTDDGLVAFVNRWSLPSLIEPQLIGRHVFTSMSLLLAQQDRLRLISSLLTRDSAAVTDTRLRFVENPEESKAKLPTGASQTDPARILGWWEVLRASDEPINWRPQDRSRPAVLMLWQYAGFYELRTGSPDEDSKVPEVRRDHVARHVAADEISDMLERHTRNTFQYLEGHMSAETVRLSDPIGTMALMLADLHTGNRHLRRCALDSCNRLFIPQYRNDQMFCRKSHANSASNKRRRRGNP